MLIIPIIGQLLPELVTTVIIGATLAILKWPYNKVTQAYAELMASVKTTNDELVHQRTNCLATIQNLNEKQLAAMNDTVRILNDIHLDQKQLLGRLDK